MKKLSISASLALIISCSAYAEDMKAIEVVTIATKTEKNIDGVSASIEVVTQEDIKKMGAQSLKDIFLRTPGLNMQYGSFPSSSSISKSSISIRGMGANGTLFLLDGRRLAGEVKNPYDLERIPASIVQRIEIVKGPMSSLYGADAVGGVINIITKQPDDEMQIDASARYGVNSYGDAQNVNLSLSVQGKEDAFGYSAYASSTTTNPYRQSEIADVYAKTPVGNVKPSVHPNPAINNNVEDYYGVDTTFREDSEIYTLGTRLTYDFSDSFIMGLDVNYFNEERDGQYIGYIHPATTGAGPVPIYNNPVNSHDENNRLDLSVDAQYAPNDDLTINARIYNSDYEKRNTTTANNWVDLGYVNEAASANAAMNADVELMVYELSSTYLLTDAHLLTGGFQYRDESRKSSVWNNNVSLTEKTVDYKSVYLQDEWEISEKFNAIFGGRYEEISNAEDKATFRIGGVYNFDKLAILRANFAQGFRTPDMREMYINMNTPNGPQMGADILGYDLKPEFTNAYELGLSGRNSKFNYEAVVFYNQIENKIEQVQNGAITTFENISDANTYGLELSLGYQIFEQLSTNFFWSELRTENEETKKDLEFNPERTFMLGFDYKASKDLDFGIDTQYIGEQHYTEIINRGAPTQVVNQNATTDAFAIVNLNLGYSVNKTIEIYGGINNVFDEKIENILGSNVGTYYFGGARIHF